MEEDISALEYARQNGLARNHLTEPPLSSIFETILEGIYDSVMDDMDLQQLHISVDYGLNERLTISKEGAQVIAWALRPEQPKSIDAVVCSMLGSRDFKMIRLELPVLKTDHESDVKEFARRQAFEPQLKDVRLPLEELDEKKNETLEFSPAIWNLAADQMEDLRKEKITVSRETLQFIQSYIINDWTDADEKEVLKTTQKYTRVSTYRHSYPA